jgi:hypothetical protein
MILYGVDSRVFSFGVGQNFGKMRGFEKKKEIVC